MRDKSYDEFMIEYFRKHPAFAASLVNDVLEDGSDQGELKYIFQHIAAAGLRASFAPAAKATAKPRARSRAAAAKTAAKRVKAPAAAKPMKRAPAAKRANATPPAMAGSAGASRSRPPLAAAGR